MLSDMPSTASKALSPSPLPKSSAPHVYGDERRGITPIRHTLKAHPALYAARHNSVGVAMRVLEMSIGGIIPTISMFYGIIISMNFNDHVPRTSTRGIKATKLRLRSTENCSRKPSPQAGSHGPRLSAHPLRRTCCGLGARRQRRPDLQNRPTLLGGYLWLTFAIYRSLLS